MCYRSTYVLLGSGLTVNFLGGWVFNYFWTGCSKLMGLCVQKMVKPKLLYMYSKKFVFPRMFK